MKILLVSEDLPAKALGGLGMHVVALGNALIAQGHTVALIGREGPEYSVSASVRLHCCLPHSAGAWWCRPRTA